MVAVSLASEEYISYTCQLLLGWYFLYFILIFTCVFYSLYISSAMTLGKVKVFLKDLI